MLPSIVSSSLLLLLLLLLQLIAHQPVASFVIVPSVASRATTATATPCQMIPSSLLDSSSAIPSTLISTIDSDIANMPTNEFATVFAGGIFVMIGAVVTTVLLGFVLEKGDLYESIVDDFTGSRNVESEEFWENLSEMERKEAVEILKSKDMELPPAAIKVLGASADAIAAAATTKEETKKEELDMFSDYQK